MRQEKKERGEMFSQTFIEKKMRDQGNDIDVIRRAVNVDVAAEKTFRLAWVTLCVLNNSRVSVDRGGLSEKRRRIASEFLEALHCIEKQFDERKENLSDVTDSIQRLRLFLAENPLVCGYPAGDVPGHTL